MEVERNFKRAMMLLKCGTEATMNAIAKSTIDRVY
jgi:hypothetical protein